MKVQIEINEKQYNVIMLALDVLSRLGAGQLEIIDELLSFDWGIHKSYNKKEIQNLLFDLKQIYFPELQRGHSQYGIYGSETQNDSKIAYDLIQVLRNKVAYSKNPNGGFTVDFSNVLPASNVELAKVYVIK